MAKFSKLFFDENEILFLGVSERYKMFSNMVFKALSKHNIKLLSVNNEKIDNFLNENKIGQCNFKVYKDFEELPKVPQAAYTILDTEDNRKIIPKLKELGIKKLLFHSKNIIDGDILGKCREAGIEAAVACPLMAYGSALHRVHGFFAGVK